MSTGKEEYLFPLSWADARRMSRRKDIPPPLMGANAPSEVTSLSWADARRMSRRKNIPPPLMGANAPSEAASLS